MSTGFNPYSTMSDVTRILNAIEQGDAREADKLLPLVYEELRRLARHKMSQEKPGQTLQATALVHEAYIRLVGEDVHNWSGQTQFLTAAAEAMRRILIEKARRKKSLRHGGNRQRVDFNDLDPPDSMNLSPDDLIALDEALERLDHKDSVKAQLVKLRYFAGLSNEQAGQILGISHNTVDKYWAYARAWLRLELAKDS
jgi:RNA polymerase sigma factor (TIGR02999 family)